MKILRDVLQLQSQGFSSISYKDYLQTNYWKNKRKKKLRQVSFICEECGSTEDLDVHHIRYKDRNGVSVLYRERMRDLQVLCRNCHELVHDLSTLNNNICIDTVDCINLLNGLERVSMECFKNGSMLNPKPVNETVKQVRKIMYKLKRNLDKNIY